MTAVCLLVYLSVLGFSTSFVGVVNSGGMDFRSGDSALGASQPGTRLIKHTAGTRGVRCLLCVCGSTGISYTMPHFFLFSWLKVVLQ